MTNKRRRTSPIRAIVFFRKVGEAMDVYRVVELFNTHRHQQTLVLPIPSTGIAMEIIPGRIAELVTFFQRAGYERIEPTTTLSYSCTSENDHPTWEITQPLEGKLGIPIGTLSENDQNNIVAVPTDDKRILTEIDRAMTQAGYANNASGENK